MKLFSISGFDTVRLCVSDVAHAVISSSEFSLARFINNKNKNLVSSNLPNRFLNYRVEKFAMVLSPLDVCFANHFSTLFTNVADSSVAQS